MYYALCIGLLFVTDVKFFQNLIFLTVTCDKYRYKNFVKHSKFVNFEHYFCIIIIGIE